MYSCRAVIADQIFPSLDLLVFFPLIFVPLQRSKKLVKGYKNGRKTKYKYPKRETHFASFLNFQTCPCTQANDGTHLKRQSYVSDVRGRVTRRRFFSAHCRYIRDFPPPPFLSYGTCR